MKKHKILDKKRLMKNTTSMISILVVALLVFSSAVSATTSSNNTMTINEKITKPIQQGIADVSPNIDLIAPSVELATSQQGNNPQTMDMWDLIFDFDVAAASGAAGNTGAMFTSDDYFYSCRWASNLHHQYNRTGVLLKQYSVSGVTNIRDLAYDGDYLYGGAASSTIMGWDPIGETLESTISGSFQARALGYNSDDDTFFCSNWADPVWEVNRDGDIVNSFDLSLTYSTYGFAYDQWGDGGPFMWVYDQTSGNPDMIYQWDLAAGVFTDKEHDTGGDIGAVIAGGLCLIEDYEPGKALLCGLGQGNGAPDTMFVYDIDTLTIPPEHDVALKKILQPESGYAVENVPMKVLIKNTGNNTETFDAQMNIIKCEGSGDMLLTENFSGDFPPEGWTTDWWQKSFTSNAGAQSPEARCYYYWQYYSQGTYWYDYYDNNITSCTVNASGLEKVNIRFAFMADVQYGCYMYLKVRKNLTSPWKDVTPWDVPITTDFQEWFEIGCYGFQTGGDIGDEFQFKFEFLGWYSDMRNWYLDDVTIEPCGGCAEYADIVDDITLAKGEEVEVEFPAWTPTEWQNESSENTYQEYPINAFTLLEGDEVEKNNGKWKLVEIYFPWMDDVGAIDFLGATSGPAQTFDMTSVITNVGQNDECCFKTHVSIAEIDYRNPNVMFTEDFNSGYGYREPTGWTTGTSQMYAWYCYNFLYYLPDPYGGGYSMRCYYYYAAGAELISPVFDTQGAGALEAVFGMFYDHDIGDYELYVDARPNPSAFWGECQPWDNPVTEDLPADWYTADISLGVGEETQLRFRTGGDYFNMWYWFLDNLEVTGYDVKEAEFTGEVCVESIVPGEELELDFGTWTPDFLAEETFDEITYILKTWTNLEDPPDKNPANNLYQRPVTLEFFHDVGIQQMTSPGNAGKGKKQIWDNGDTDGANGYSLLGSPRRSLLDDFELAKTSKISEYRCYMLWPSSHATDWETTFWTDDGGEPGEVIETGTTVSFSDTATGRTWFGYQEYEVIYEFEPISLKKGTYWVEGWTTATTPNSFQMIRLDMWGSQLWANYDDFGGLQPGQNIFGVQADLSYQLWGTFGAAPSIEVYAQPGTQNIDAIVENLGTFPELDLTCYTEIYEFITNCTVGTLVYEDNISDIDLDVPLGGTETLNFDSYNFAIEGTFGIFLNMSLDVDNFPNNNLFEFGIGIDDTSPGSSHSLVPAAPDGDNGWYVSNVEVTLDATDPSIGCEADGSGTETIKYKIGSGSWQSIDQTEPGKSTLSGTFTIDVDADDLPIEYYAVDYVGNEELHNSFTIDMDQTVPDIEEVTWESFQEPPIYGLWYVTFTCDATDETSDMDRVEMFINDGFHEEVIGTGPTYEFTIEWSAAFKTVTFWFYHYDVAGNVIADDLLGSEPVSYANYQQQSNPVSKKLAHQ